MNFIKFSKKSLLISFIILIAIIFPFWKESSENIYPAIKVNDSSIGYYQSTTCNISLLNVFKENINSDLKIRYNNNNYAGIECFGKVTGLDKVNDTYFVSIGTNSNITFLLQALIWVLLLFSISGKSIRIDKFDFTKIILLSVFFTLQQFSEERFYSQVNKYFNLSISFDNFYLINVFLSFYTVILLISVVFHNYKSTLINFFPYMFLIVGAFNGFNLNFYSILLSYIGITALFERKFNKKTNIIYILFTIAWLQTTREAGSFFDTDKLNGFINSSNNFYSLVYWSVLILFMLNGVIYIYKNSKFDFDLINTNLLIASNLILILGITGAASPLQNFFNFIIFGQNKRGINSLSAVDGNTWRGFSSSAESIGEFYGFVLLFYFLMIFFKKIKFNYKVLALTILPVYGLYESNNFASIISLIIILLLIFAFKNYRKNQFRNILLTLFFLSIVGSFFLVNKLGYEYVSTQLLYEASLHSNLFSGLSSEAKSVEITQYFNAGDIESLINIENKNNGSSLLVYLSNIFFQSNFNVPLIPNLVTLISFISIIINRNEMWGIFIAKYNPNIIELLFGNGPNQLNNYLFKLNINLDVPFEKINSLYLPHSSFLDIFLFFGVVGIFIFILWNLYILGNNSEEPQLKFLLIFLLLNLSKSDSLLYLNSVFMLFFIYMIILSTKVKNNEQN